jgi:hypothetical protein
VARAKHEKVVAAVVAYSTVPRRRDPHEGEKKQGPLGGVSSGRWYASYPASEHMHDDMAYCCLSGIIWTFSHCYNEL